MSFQFAERGLLFALYGLLIFSLCFGPDFGTVDSDSDDDSDGLVVSEYDATIAVVEVEGHDEEDGDDHGDEHGNALHVEGVSSGSTSFKLQLMHDGHSDYTSTNNVPVTVN